MLLTITSETPPATDLGYLLHKNPARVHRFDLPFGAARTLDAATLSESALYTSTEPCLMCSGAIHWAGIGKIVYGTTASQMFEAAGGHERGIPVREAFARMASGVEIVGPVMEEEGLALHLDYWPGS